jgi:Uma2 family endonuclease
MSIQPLDKPSSPLPRRWKWSGDDLLKLARLGVLPPDQRLELLDGEILEAMPTGPLHAVIVALIAEMLRALPGQQFHVREEKPVRLDPYSEPLSDVALVRGYAERLPVAADVLLLVEVADSSLEFDREGKLAAYASAGIPEYWIANLRELQVEVHLIPEGAQYLLRRIHRVGDSVAPSAAPESFLAVAALLGQA